MTHSTAPHDADGQPFESRGARPSDPRRRLAVEYLSARDSSIVLDELAAVVAARESRQGAHDGATTDHVALALHHVHLPRLAGVGLVEYDAEQRVVAPARAEALSSRSNPPDDSDNGA